MLTHASLFSGIGGFDLAAEWAGFHNLFHCEINEFSKQVLKYHFPESVSYEDITKTNFREWRGKVTVLSGGFPCQPFSVAGERNGDCDERYLWPEMLRVIDEIRPTWVIGENVAGIASMVQSEKVTRVESQADIFNQSYHIETSSSEYIISAICRSLEEIGYSIQPVIIPACAVNAPHRRDRVWFIARLKKPTTHSNSKLLQTRNWIKWQADKTQDAAGMDVRVKRHACLQSITYASSIRLQSWFNSIRFNKAILGKSSRLHSRSCSRKRHFNDWEKFPAQSPIYIRDDGVSYELAGRPISKNKWREESVKACGNAIVPQVAYEIFNNIKQIELCNNI